MQSKITGGPTTQIFTARVLSKYDVKYFRCNETGFIQTEEPYWLHEAYSSAIVSLDVGLAERNEKMVADTQKLLLKYYREANKFLDFGGGYGQFVRMMRDRGFNFYLFDEYAENLYARFFSVDAGEFSLNKFDVITAFEVFEHLTDPFETIERLAGSTDSILFSTELSPAQSFSSSDDWWYFVPEIGQHIAFHTKDSLEYMGNKLGFNLYTNNTNLHLLTKRKFAKDPFAYLKIFKPFEKTATFINKLPHKLSGNKRRPSLMSADSEMIEKSISQ
jgi:hypothetical protein